MLRVLCGLFDFPSLPSFFTEPSALLFRVPHSCRRNWTGNLTSLWKSSYILLPIKYRLVWAAHGASFGREAIFFSRFTVFIQFESHEYNIRNNDFHSLQFEHYRMEMLKKGNENNYLSWYNIFCKCILCLMFGFILWPYSRALFKRKELYICLNTHTGVKGLIRPVKTGLHFQFQLIERLILSFSLGGMPQRAQCASFRADF